MNRYRLRANYDIENIDSRKENGTMIVDVPMLSNGKLNYGLRHIKQKLYEEEVYPSEIGFDIMSFATMVYMAESREQYMDRILGQEKLSLRYRYQI